MSVRRRVPARFAPHLLAPWLLAPWVLALFLLAFCPAGPAFAAGECRPREAVTSFGRWFDPGVDLDATHWSLPIPHGLAGTAPTSFRLLVAVKADMRDRAWNIVIRDERMRVLASLGPGDFANADGRLDQRRWTGRLPARALQADLIAASSSDAVATIVEGLAYGEGGSQTQLFSIQGATPAWKPLYDTDDLVPKRAGDAVGMLLTGAVDPDGQDKASWCCSGVMLSADLMLTNWHCGGTRITPDAAYWNADVRDNLLVDLSWDDGLVRRAYGGVDVVAKDRDLDFALVRVRPVVGSSGGEAVAARISTAPLSVGEAIFVIHHAQCRPKLVSRLCEVRATRFRGWTTPPGPGAEAAGPDFTHDCDTEPGASGSPVFDAAGRLVGLHHLGFETKPDCGIDHVNKAVRIADIVDELRRTHPDLVATFRIEP